MFQVEVLKANGKTISNRNQTLDRLKVCAYCRVSTDTKDQINSYNSQVTYYKNLIKDNPKWIFAGIYADPGITGTKTEKREEFNKMINDAKEGKIDMILTKSISRFARNTLDTLKYVRLLKGLNVSVKFEEENINTLTMEGEMLLTILSSVAQQEVENISANVKKGLKMKMQRGEMVGFKACLGYDYDKETRNLVINEREAEIVRYVFNRFLDGYGSTLIGKELEEKGYLNKEGKCFWPEGTVYTMVKNEKYKGDLMMGKTYTLDPITKRKMKNYGEQDMFYVKNHHEPIVSREIWDRVNEILAIRSAPRKKAVEGLHLIKTKMYPFSLVTKCGFCGGPAYRRTVHSSTPYAKPTWRCICAAKKGKKLCPESVSFDEEILEEAFLEAFNKILASNDDTIKEFLEDLKTSLNLVDNKEEIDSLMKEVDRLDVLKEKLIQIRTEGVLSKEDFENKYLIYQADESKLRDKVKVLKQEEENSRSTIDHVNNFLKTLKEKEELTEFNDNVFNSVIEKVIIGEKNDDGTSNPYMVSFIFTGGFITKVDLTKDRHIKRLLEIRKYRQQNKT